MTSKNPLLQPPTEITSKIYSVEYYLHTVVIWLTFPIQSDPILKELEACTHGGLEYFDNTRKPPGYNSDEIFRLPFHHRYIAMLRLYYPANASFAMLQDLQQDKRVCPERRNSIVQSQIKVTGVTFCHEIICRSPDDATLVASYLNSVSCGKQNSTKPPITYRAVTSDIINEAAAQALLVFDNPYSLHGVNVHGLSDLKDFNHRKLWQSELLLQQGTRKKDLVKIDTTDFLREYPEHPFPLEYYRSIDYEIPA